MSDRSINASSQEAVSLQPVRLNLPVCGRYILLVEDNDDARDITLELLEMLGHHVCAVASAEEALERLNMDQLEVLLTDITLPAMSGIDLAILAKQRHPHLDIIFSSGHDKNNLRLPDITVSYLLKPYTLAQLEQALSITVERFVGPH